MLDSERDEGFPGWLNIGFILRCETKQGNRVSLHDSAQTSTNDEQGLCTWVLCNDSSILQLDINPIKQVTDRSVLPSATNHLLNHSNY